MMTAPSINAIIAALAVATAVAYWIKAIKTGDPAAVGGALLASMPAIQALRRGSR